MKRNILIGLVVLVSVMAMSFTADVVKYNDKIAQQEINIMIVDELPAFQAEIETALDQEDYTAVFSAGMTKAYEHKELFIYLMKYHKEFYKFYHKRTFDQAVRDTQGLLKSNGIDIEVMYNKTFK